MIKFCACGTKETIQPYQDCRWIKGPCSACRRKHITASVTTHSRVAITRTEAKVLLKDSSILSKVKFR